MPDPRDRFCSSCGMSTDPGVSEQSMDLDLPNPPLEQEEEAEEEEGEAG